MFIPFSEETAPKRNIYDELEGKILTCKRDITCKEGVFKRNASVFPTIVNYKIDYLYDLREWNCDTVPDTVCPKGTVLEHIDISNYVDYLEVNEKGSELYNEMQKLKKNIENKKVNYNESCRALFEFGLIMFTGAVVVAAFEWVYGALLFLMLSVLGFGSMMIIKMLKKRKIMKLNASLDVIKEDLLSNIMSFEQFSGEDEYIKMKEKLVELAKTT